MILTAPVNKPVDKVDLDRFAGKWYSLYSIPTMYDKGSRETTTAYTLTRDGYYKVFTACKKGEEQKSSTYNSKLFTDGDTDGEMHAQFLWPFKVDYWVIELADDYSYVVVGHPEHKFLFIMSRKPAIDKKLHDEIVGRCKAKGYEVDKLTSQHHGE
ncbi:lipocalin family protein [Mucilaginibacter myungsuensis]|uniref:Lipocalin family protein n=2 Tax=Mucilaginibacter myungsuensis TaxID=649104 RepID=A0A929KZ31_9SPHI|nr:lipocalin family protein [Mucilaginibacter myungsuensis]